MSREKLLLTTVEQRAAENLRRVRDHHRFTTSSLAEATEKLRDVAPLNRTAISHIENGRRRMSLADAWTLSLALDVSPLEFFLPLDSQDGQEFAEGNDQHGPNVLPNRLVRHLYRLPDDSAPERQRKIARQVMTAALRGEDTGAPAADVDQGADRLDALEKSVELLRAELRELRNG